MGQQGFYIRNRGRVTGPFTLEQLKSLRNRGQLGRFHELSEDRQTWAPASAYSQVFPGGAGATTDDWELLPDKAVNASAPSLDWHYVDGAGNQQGPVAAASLLTLLQKGTITESTLVWRAGLPNWVELASPQSGIIPRQSQAASSVSQSGTRTSRFAITALLLSVLWLGGIGSLLGIIFSLVALRRIKLDPGRMGGKPVAVTALVLGAILLALTPIGLLVYLKVRHPGPIAVSGSASTQEITAQELTETYRNKVYTVRADKSGGSGVLLANNSRRGLIATNLHVVDPELEQKPELKQLINAPIPKPDVLVKNVTQLNLRPARLAAFHRRRDLALLVIEVREDQPAATVILSQKSLKQGEGAVALGNPQGMEFFTTSGIISSTSGERGYIWTTCPVSSGNSGGPLVLNRRGFLVGINTTGSRDVLGVTQNLNGSIPAEEIVLSLRSEQADSWVWAEDLKQTVLRLGDMIHLEE